MGLLPRRHVAVSVLLLREQWAFGEPEVGGNYASRSALWAQLPRRPAPIVCPHPWARLAILMVHRPRAPPSSGVSNCVCICQLSGAAIAMKYICVQSTRDLFLSGVAMGAIAVNVPSE